jgi:hypothetical protein
MGRPRGKEITEADIEEILADVRPHSKVQTRARVKPQESAPTAAIEVSVVGVEGEPELGFESYPLSAAELEAKAQLEAQVKEAFYVAGSALRALRDLKLYRATHKTFEAYCRAQFKFERAYAYFQINAADIYENLKSQMYTNGIHYPLPTAEKQLRDLASLQPTEQVEVWQEAAVRSQGKIPTGRIVKQIIREMFPPTNFPDIGVNDVCQILVKDNPELAGKNKCWGIVFQVLETVCWVACWDGQYQVPKENLQPFEYSPAQRESMSKLERRLRRFQDGAVVVEAASYTILQQFGKVERPFLTELEEALLKFLEDNYGLLSDRSDRL